ncbi:MAG: cysteine synthase family protein [Cytophagales bacterium]|nr:cysteine synthase family protein [Armatimonadota bacterium]
MTTILSRSNPYPLTPQAEAGVAPGSRDIEELVGNTPLIRLKNLAADLPSGVRVYGKAEFFNPGGSVKDRAALSMVRDGERRGLLSPGKTIIDASSGNTGIAYAWIGAALGYQVRICLPENASPERKKMLKAFGAEVTLTSAQEGTDGAQRLVKEIVAREPGRYFYPDQYNNDANWRAHYHGTAGEIWEQTGGQITHFVAGLGTTGTFVGTTRRLKELNPLVQCLSFQPEFPLHGLEGMKHLATALVPGIWDEHLPDQQLWASTEEAYTMVKRLAREEGLFVGISAGAAVATSLKVARTLSEGVVVTILCDGADKYLSDRFWDED